MLICQSTQLLFGISTVVSSFKPLEHNCYHFRFKSQTHFILKNIYFNQNLTHQTGLIKMSSFKKLRSLSEYNKEKNCLF